MEESLQTVAAVIEVPSFDLVGIAHFIWRKLIVLIQGLITGVGRACFAELFFILIYIKRTFAEPPYHTDPGKSPSRFLLDEAPYAQAYLDNATRKLVKRTGQGRISS